MNSNFSTSNDAPGSPKVAKRRYKSCRICRRQKLRCDGGSPCERCRLSGEACVYDIAAGRRRNPNGSAALRGASSSQANQVEYLSAQVQRLQQAVIQSQGGDIHREAPSSSAAASLQPYDAGRSSTEHTTPAAPPDCEALSPDDLEQPVTAVHVMVHPNRRGTATRWTPHNQSRWNREEYHVGSVIERALVDESQARRLFGNFMQDCNVATPIFDPVLDTFESVRELYPLTMTVVLYLAARQDPSDDVDSLKILETESRRLAADTLFENPCSLDSVKAMLLLSVHSEKTWFAIGHTLQMAADLGLNYSMNRATTKPESCSRYDFHCARLWLFIVYFERAVALGTRRIPRCNSIDPSDLEVLVESRYSHPSEIFFYGSLELFDMSASLRLLAELPSPEQIEQNLDAWLNRWNAHYDKQCIHSSSLQRVHLAIQMLFAKTWQLASCLVRQLRPLHQSDTRTSISTLLDHILLTNNQLHRKISGSSAYIHYFPWSPTCELLLLIFTVILGRKALSLMNPAMMRSHQDGFKEFAILVADLLRKHPCQRFSNMVDEILLQHQKSTEASESQVQSETNLEAGAVQAETASAGDLGWLETDWTTTSAQFEELFGEWAAGEDWTVKGLMGQF